MAQEGEVQHAGTMTWIKLNSQKQRYFANKRNDERSQKHCELKLWFSHAVVTLKCSTNSLSTFNWLCSIFPLDSLGWPETESIHQTSKNLHYFHTKCWKPFSFTILLAEMTHPHPEMLDILISSLAPSRRMDSKNRSAQGQLPLDPNSEPESWNSWRRFLATEKGATPSGWRHEVFFF